MLRGGCPLVLSFAVRRLLLVVCCLLFGARCLWCVVRYALFVAYCLLFVGRCALCFVGCHVLVFVVRCLLSGV